MALNPKTRIEHFIAGREGELPIGSRDPETRIEFFLAGREDELPAGHQEPESRLEHFIKDYRSGGDITVIPLTVTENGDYTAPEGKAYSPVAVNVALPQNALLLKDIPSTPTAIATFDDGAEMVMPSLTVGVEAVQDLHGYDNPWVGGAGKNKFDVDLPHQSISGSLTYTYNLTLKPNTTYTMSSNVPKYNPASLYFNGGATNINGVWNGTPRTFTSDENGNLVVYVRYDESQGGIDLYTAVKNGTYYIQLEEGSTATTFAPYSNICPISGWDEVNVTVADDVNNPTVSNVYTIDLNGTRYGGRLEIVNGIAQFVATHGYVDLGTLDYRIIASGESPYFATTTPLSPTYKYINNNQNVICSHYVYASIGASGSDEGFFLVNSGYLRIRDNRYSDIESFKEMLTTNNAQLVYELAEPTIIPLGNYPISSLVGENNLFADSGEILEGEYLGGVS